ncbi:hypothetical protein VIGAN_01329100 [Vigna angularis var. angularis]|uniref:Uncharacterized protein n=1 Tax=Vigna angularis var. angularis TaxID=157739 RepID=A0A0S3R4K2_PHAAN|nr:hypothetical protein VIGAN_01329100 [Vigna angularis var. angularis]
MEGRMVAMESTVEELKAEVRAMNHEFQQAFGRRSRNRDQGSEGSRNSVIAKRERQSSESSEEESEDDQGEIQRMCMLESVPHRSVVLLSNLEFNCLLD